jgi:hypothetical protein
MATLTGTVIFDLFAPEGWIDQTPCYEWHAETPQPLTCRGCSVSAGIDLAEKAGQMTVLDWRYNWFHPEHKVWGRRFYGTVNCDEGRYVLTRVLAYIQGHPEPPVPHAR